MNWIVNAFSLNMLPRAHEHQLVVREISREEAREWARDAASAVGHAETAAVLSTELNRGVEYDRRTVQLGPTDQALVAQYEGPRLAAGATELPPDARFRWLLIGYERCC